ncbi:hypothetical protein JCM3766R1_003360 [Sporobolomyces carnicolor]
MFTTRLARLALDSITETLLVLFPPAPLPLIPNEVCGVRKDSRAVALTEKLSRLDTGARKRPTEQGGQRTRPQPCHELDGPARKPRANAPPRRKVLRSDQAKRNSHALSLKQPLKSCFRTCRANERFGLPSSFDGFAPLDQRRRVVFSDPIDDGGDFPRHKPLAIELETELLDERQLAKELDPLVISSSSPSPRHPSSRSARDRSTLRKCAAPLAAPRDGGAVNRKHRKVPQLAATPQSRLKMPPLPGQVPTRRIVAYSFHR